MTTHRRQDGQPMMLHEIVPDWVPEDLRVDWAEKVAICIEAGLEMPQAARQADGVVLRALADREARHG